MIKVMSMASSVADFPSVGLDPSGMGVVIMGRCCWGGAAGLGTLCGAALTGAGCWVLAPSALSGMTIICFPLLWKRRGAIESMRLMEWSP